jgi:hypothetical protein
MNNWKLIYKSNKYYYWKHQNDYYNCTVDNSEPKTGTGYINLVLLGRTKNEPLRDINNLILIFSDNQ